MRPLSRTRAVRPKPTPKTSATPSARPPRRSRPCGRAPATCSWMTIVQPLRRRRRSMKPPARPLKLPVTCSSGRLQRRFDTLRQVIDTGALGGEEAKPSMCLAPPTCAPVTIRWPFRCWRRACAVPDLGLCGAIDPQSRRCAECQRAAGRGLPPAVLRPGRVSPRYRRYFRCLRAIRAA